MGIQKHRIMASATQWVLVGSAAAIALVTTIGLIVVGSDVSDHSQKNFALAARALVARSQRAAEANELRLNQSFQSCGRTYCVTSFVVKMPSKGMCGGLDIVATDESTRGKKPIYTSDKASTLPLCLPT